MSFRGSARGTSPATAPSSDRGIFSTGAGDPPPPAGILPSGCVSIQGAPARNLNVHSRLRRDRRIWSPLGTDPPVRRNRPRAGEIVHSGNQILQPAPSRHGMDRAGAGLRMTARVGKPERRCSRRCRGGRAAACIRQNDRAAPPGGSAAQLRCAERAGYSRRPPRRRLIRWRRKSSTTAPMNAVKMVPANPPNGVVTPS
jgi:hypothetical protein